MRGGRREGAGRPKGRRTVRNVAMKAELWNAVDRLIEKKAITRVQFFEEAVTEKLKEENKNGN